MKKVVISLSVVCLFVFAIGGMILGVEHHPQHAIEWLFWGTFLISLSTANIVVFTNWV